MTKQQKKKTVITIEEIDEIANTIMDILRKIFHIKPESDKDDNIYSCIHNIVKQLTFKK